MFRLPGCSLLIVAGMTLLSRGSSASSSESDTVTIIDSGSTNRAGFRIEVRRSGLAEMTTVRRKTDSADAPTEPLRRTVSSTTAQRFFADLEKAKPIASLPQVHCMKSASFGSSLMVAVGNEQTPDLSCGDGGNAAMRDLIRDVHEIVSLFQSQ
jgi:hypothetical protein